MSSLGVALGVALGLAVAVGLAVEGASVGPGVAVGSTAPTDGATVGAVVGRAVGWGVDRGLAVGSGVGFGVGFGVGLGVAGCSIVTDPAAIESAKRSRLSAAIDTGWVPTGSFPDQRNVTPRFQSSPLTLVIPRVEPATVTRTQSAGDPSRFRYETVMTIVVVGFPDLGETVASDRRVGPAAAHAGTTADSTSTAAAIDATIRVCHPPMRDLDGVTG